MSRWVEFACRPKVVLLVDDCAQDRELFQIAAEDRDVEILVACNGEEALALLAERDDISDVMLDLNLPGMSGLELFNRIEHMAHRPHVTLYTGAPADAAQAAMTIGVCSFLAKSAENFREKIGRLLTSRGIPQKERQCAVA